MAAELQHTLVRVATSLARAGNKLLPEHAVSYANDLYGFQVYLRDYKGNDKERQEAELKKVAHMLAQRVQGAAPHMSGHGAAYVSRAFAVLDLKVHGEMVGPLVAAAAQSTGEQAGEPLKIHQLVSMILWASRCQPPVSFGNVKDLVRAAVRRTSEMETVAIVELLTAMNVYGRALGSYKQLLLKFALPRFPGFSPEMLSVIAHSLSTVEGNVDRFIHAILGSLSPRLTELPPHIVVPLSFSLAKAAADVEMTTKAGRAEVRDWLTGIMSMLKHDERGSVRSTNRGSAQLAVEKANAIVSSSIDKDRFAAEVETAKAAVEGTDKEISTSMSNRSSSISGDLGVSYSAASGTIAAGATRLGSSTGSVITDMDLVEPSGSFKDRSPYLGVEWGALHTEGLMQQLRSVTTKSASSGASTSSDESPMHQQNSKESRVSGSGKSMKKGSPEDRTPSTSGAPTSSPARLPWGVHDLPPHQAQFLLRAFSLMGMHDATLYDQLLDLILQPRVALPLSSLCSVAHALAAVQHPILQQHARSLWEKAIASEGLVSNIRQQVAALKSHEAQATSFLQPPADAQSEQTQNSRTSHTATTSCVEDSQLSESPSSQYRSIIVLGRAVRVTTMAESQPSPSISGTYSDSTSADFDPQAISTKRLDDLVKLPTWLAGSLAVLGVRQPSLYLAVLHLQSRSLAQLKPHLLLRSLEALACQDETVTRRLLPLLVNTLCTLVHEDQLSSVTTSVLTIPEAFNILHACEVASVSASSPLVLALEDQVASFLESKILSRGLSPATKDMLERRLVPPDFSSARLSDMPFADLIGLLQDMAMYTTSALLRTRGEVVNPTMSAPQAYAMARNSGEEHTFTGKGREEGGSYTANRASKSHSSDLTDGVSAIAGVSVSGGGSGRQGGISHPAKQPTRGQSGHLTDEVAAIAGGSVSGAQSGGEGRISHSAKQPARGQSSQTLLQAVTVDHRHLAAASDSGSGSSEAKVCGAYDMFLQVFCERLTHQCVLLSDSRLTPHQPLWHMITNGLITAENVRPGTIKGVVHKLRGVKHAGDVLGRHTLLEALVIDVINSRIADAKTQ